MAARLSASLRARGGGQSDARPPVGGGGPGPGGSSSRGFGGRRLRNRVDIPSEKYPDINFLGLLIGPRGATQRRMQEESGARILIRGRGSSRDGRDEDASQPLHVVIEGGTQEQVDRGTKLVEDLVLNPDNARRLKQRQLQSMGTRYDTNDRTAYRDTRGGGDNRGRGGGADFQSREVRIPNGDAGLVIGRGGETINRLQHESGARIQVARQARPGSPNRIVTVTGPPDAISRAENAIHRIMGGRGGRGGYDGRSQGGGGLGPGERKTLLVPNATVGRVIGRGGDTIRQLRQNTGATIRIASETGSRDREVLLSGTSEQVAKAEAEIMAMVQDEMRYVGGAGGHQGGHPQGGPTPPPNTHIDTSSNPQPPQPPQPQMAAYGGGGGFYGAQQPQMMYGGGYGGGYQPHPFPMGPPQKPDPAYQGTPTYAQQMAVYENYQRWLQQQEEAKKRADEAKKQAEEAQKNAPQGEQKQPQSDTTTSGAAADQQASDKAAPATDGKSAAPAPPGAGAGQYYGYAPYQQGPHGQYPQGYQNQQKYQGYQNASENQATSQPPQQQEPAAPPASAAPPAPLPALDTSGIHPSRLALIQGSAPSSQSGRGNRGYGSGDRGRYDRGRKRSRGGLGFATEERERQRRRAGGGNETYGGAR